MLNRRNFVSFLSILPFSFSILKAKESKTEVPFLSKDLLKEKYLKIFPDGFFITEENVQKLLDNGLDINEFSFPITGKFVVRNIGTMYYKNGVLHRDDGPAYIRSDGTQHYCKNGVLHREDGPAVISSIGDQMWYINGKCHREDGPAVIYKNGTQKWYKNGDPWRIKNS